MTNQNKTCSMNKTKHINNAWKNRRKIIPTMLLFGADYVTFWRRLCYFLAQNQVFYVTFWRRLCYFLAQAKFVYCIISTCYIDFLLLINNLINNSNKLFNELFNNGKSLPKTFWGSFEALPINGCASSIDATLCGKLNKNRVTK